LTPAKLMGGGGFWGLGFGFRVGERARGGGFSEIGG